MDNNSSIFLKIAVPMPFRRYFDYLPLIAAAEKWQPLKKKLKIGMRVKVPFNHRECIGIFMGFAEKTDVPLKKLKAIIAILDTESVIPMDVIAICQWASDYYHYPIGEILTHALPARLRQGKLLLSQCKPAPILLTPLDTNKQEQDKLRHILNHEQQAAVSAIQAAYDTFSVFLLDGVTGSGKTEVYLQTMSDVLAQGKQVLVLVPEISLTPQTLQRFRARCTAPVVAWHSGLTEKERFTTWELARSSTAKVVIGTRSAIFCDLPDLALIIVDEEHDMSFKQQEGFRYHGRDLAIMRANFKKIPIILGSATPALETLHNMQQQKFIHLPLRERAGCAHVPQFSMLDIRNQSLQEGLSHHLLEEIELHLKRNEQVMLFLNRRGFAPILLCHHCGWMAICKRCDMRMTYHQKTQRLHCHHCDTQISLIKSCEACGKPDLQPVGLGTERIETVLQKKFPDHAIARIDRDTTRKKGSINAILESIHAGEQHILIGTQMLAKGHHFPNVTLVAIIDADGGFFSSDFRALERMGQLLLQVAGRAGRMEKKGKVIVQTHHPTHPLLHQLFYSTYQEFASTLLKERLLTRLPPFSFFALFRAEAHQLEDAMRFLREVKKKFSQSSLFESSEIQLLGPIEAPMPKKAGKHRVQLLLQANQRPLLQRFLKNNVPLIEKIEPKKRVRWSLDVDPIEMF